MKPLVKKITSLTIFSIAMGFMETAVVVYLRKIYYPDGFHFPLIPIDSSIASVEVFREAATIIMLLFIGILTGKTITQRFAFFIYCFAIWDLFYYVFLKMLIGWPESLFAWDILFLIPVPWVGPVLAPCIVSATMILFTLLLIHYEEIGVTAKIKRNEWILLSMGSLIIIISFTLDYFQYISQNTLEKSYWTLASKELLFSDISNYVPAKFYWWLFAIGELMIVSGILSFNKRVKTTLITTHNY